MQQGKNNFHRLTSPVSISVSHMEPVLVPCYTNVCQGTTYSKVQIKSFTKQFTGATSLFVTLQTCKVTRNVLHLAILETPPPQSLTPTTRQRVE